MRTIKIKPGSAIESTFLNVLKNHGVKMNLLIKRDSSMSESRLDEYLLSDGLFGIVHTELSAIRGLCI